MAFAERLRAGWDPRNAEVDLLPRDSSGFSRTTAPLGTMQAGNNGAPDTTWSAVAADTASPVSASRDQVWRRVGLVLAVVTLLLAALWLLGALPNHSTPRETPSAPNDSIAPGRETGASRPPSGIGAR